MSGLGQEFPGKVVGRNEDATTEGARAAVKELGFQAHGIVIRDASGKPLWKQADHEVDMEDVRRELETLTR